VLGGVDATAFVTEDMAAYGSLIRSFSRELRFLALRLAHHTQAFESVLRLTDDASCVQLYALNYDKWKALCELGLAHLRALESTGLG
jgi:hypothetical protein